ncbi:MAG: IS1 family transposase [Treponema sp.]|nr:IS1 family transposase [Treponema sp.]
MMNSLEQILENINKLSQTDLDRLLSLLADKNTKTEIFDHFVENKRFKKGIVCPHCKSTSTVRNGLNKLTQRYICKGCRKSFTVRTNTITASSKKSLVVWKKFLSKNVPIRNALPIRLTE